MLYLTVTTRYEIVPGVPFLKHNPRSLLVPGYSSRNNVNIRVVVISTPRCILIHEFLFREIGAWLSMLSQCLHQYHNGIKLDEYIQIIYLSMMLV